MAPKLGFQTLIILLVTVKNEARPAATCCHLVVHVLSSHMHAVQIATFT